MGSRHSQESSADALRGFAIEVVRTLRAAGFDALWAGGCVRDQLLGLEPKDYDVATSATPDDVIRIFGPRRTVPVGACFGVVIVLGPAKAAGQVEVATYRSDGSYLDGRRPATVTFCRPEEDARRRDFTINGMFLDPLSGTVIDYVGGQADLAAGVIRAIGDPFLRFSEDKLRLLRAVRFSATMGYQLEAETAAAIARLHHQLQQVSVERIAQELRRMLAHPARGQAFRLLNDTGLLSEVFGGVDRSVFGIIDFSGLCRTLQELTTDRFEPGFAEVVRHLTHSTGAPPPESAGRHAAAICQWLKFSNEETACVVWLLTALAQIDGIRDRPLHVLKPLLADPRAAMSLELSRAIAVSHGQAPLDAEFCRNYLARNSASQLNPQPLITGRDVLELGIPAGPAVRRLLDRVRCEQLDELLLSRDQGLARLRELADSQDFQSSAPPQH